MLISREEILKLAEYMGIKVTFDNKPEDVGFEANGELYSFDEFMNAFNSVSVLQKNKEV